MRLIPRELSHPVVMMMGMRTELLDRAVELMEKANADLEPELLTAAQARKLIRLYSQIEKLGAFGVTALAATVGDPQTVARAAGTSMGKARKIVATGHTLASSGELASALQSGAISLDQATAISPTVEVVPDAAAELVDVARSEAFHVLKDRARAIKLDAEQHDDLAERQREARSARTYIDDLGMGHIHLIVEPHRYAPIVARGEAEAARLARADKKAKRKAGSDEGPEPFERYLADAYVNLLAGGAGTGTGRATRPELVVLVSHEVVKRGWTDVRDGEVCKIPGVGPVAPAVAREIAGDAFLNGVFYDGVDLRHFKRWSRHISREVAIALELGEPPDFDGVKCADCGRRLFTEFDHVEPHVAGGPMSTTNVDARCWSCHSAKTERDRRAGKLRAPPPPDP